MDERTIIRPDRQKSIGLLLKWAAPCLLMSMALCAGCGTPGFGLVCAGVGC